MDFYKIDDYAEFRFNTQTLAGVATDADALPTYRIYEENNETAVATGNCAKRDDANTTGYYIVRAQCTAAAGFEVGVTYGVRVAATVDAVAGAEEIGRFRIVPVAVWNALFGGSDYLPVETVELANDAITAASINDGAITNAKVADDVDVNTKTITAGAIVAASFGANAITNAAVADDVDVNVKTVSAGAITNTAVADDVDVNVKTITANAITSAAINDGAITNAKVADDVDVNVKTITNGAIASASFAAGALDAVWTTAARTLTAFGTVAADAATAVWGAAARTLTATAAPTDMAKESTLTAIKGVGWDDETLVAIQAAIPGAAPSVGDIRTELEGVGTHLTTIKAKTDNLPADPAGVSDLPSEPPSAADIADAVLDEPLGTHAGLIATNLDAKVSEVAGDVDLTPVTDVLTAIKGATWDADTDTLEDIRDAIPAAAPSAATIVDAVLNEPVGAHTGFIATNLDGKISEIEATVDFAEIQGAGWDADTDTLEEISDAVAAISLAGDLIAFAYTVTRDGVPVEGALVRFCSDAGYETQIKSGYTNALGVVTMNVPAATYYITVDAPGQARAYDSEPVS